MVVAITATARRSSLRPPPRIFCAVAFPPIMRVALTLGFAVLLLTTGFSSPAPQGPASTVAVADTLRFTVTPGQPLVVQLPGAGEAEFRGLRLPALSLIVDGTFAWTTLAAERGREYVHIQRRTPTRTDTLVLVVELAE